jgi:hypothetical protein
MPKEKICSNETMMEAPTLSNIYFCSLLPVNLFKTQMGHAQQTTKMVESSTITDNNIGE